MDTLIRLAPVVGCLAMGVMMWLMMRGQHGPNQQHNMTDPNTQEEINRLRAEITLLKQDKASGSQTIEPETRP